MSVDLSKAVTVSQGSGEGERSSVLMSGTSMGRDCWGSKAITSMSTISSRSSGVSMSIRTRGGGITMSIGGRCSVNGVSTLDNMSIESIVIIGSVVDGTGGSISLHKTVVSLYDITITSLALALLVSGMSISNAVLEGILGVSLKKKKKNNRHQIVIL
jgi:hypothetical protein